MSVRVHLSLAFGLICIPHCFEAQATMSLNLTAATTASLSGAVCPQATIHCVAENLPSLVLLWFFNSVIVTQYTIPLVGMDEYPFRLDLPSQFANASGVIEVEAASQSEENSVHSNSVSTLRANLSMLREAGVTSISCGSANTRSETYALNFSIALSPGPFSSPCLLQPESPETASLQWPPDVQNPVDVYRVHVSPAPNPTSSCPLEVGPGDSYHCSGLRIGVRYNITVNATNCNEQESITTFTVAPRVPSAPMDVTVTAIYNHQVMLKEVAVQWRSFPIVSERCAFPEETNHTVILQDSSGATADVISFTSDCCVRDVCSTFNCGSSFKQFSQIDGNYSVSITSKNVFGQSTADSVTGIAFSYQSLFNLTLTFENCQTSVICSSTSRAGSCSVGFSFTSSNQELAAVAFNKSLNVQFDLLLDRSTEYYVQANVTVDGTAFQLRRNFSTGIFDPRLTTLNIALTAAGTVLLFMALVADLLLIVIVAQCKKTEDAPCNVHVPLGFFFLEVVVMLLFATDIALWIAVWVYAGQKTDTCDLKWQSIRNDLIIAAFFISVTSFCGVIITLVIVLAKKCRSSKELELEKFGTKPPDKVDSSKVQNCAGCNRKFGITLWKRNCAGCGNVLCKKCLNMTVYLPYLSKMEKVCNNCYIRSQKGVGKSTKDDRENLRGSNKMTDDHELLPQSKPKSTLKNGSSLDRNMPETKETDISGKGTRGMQGNKGSGVEGKKGSGHNEASRGSASAVGTHKPSGDKSRSKNGTVNSVKK